MGSQCKGTTKSGIQCKMTGVFSNGYCRLHQNQYHTEIKSDTVISEGAKFSNNTCSPEENSPLSRPENIAPQKKSTLRSPIRKRTIVCSLILIAAFSWLSKKLTKK